MDVQSVVTGPVESLRNISNSRDWKLYYKGFIEIMWIVIEGSIKDGFDFYGPFDAYEEATDFCNHLIGLNVCVLLKDPKEELESLK